jgi:hypothetical protein
MPLLNVEVTACILVASLLCVFSQLVYFIHAGHHMFVVTYIQIAFSIFSPLSIRIT